MADQLSDIINKKRELQDAEDIKNKILGIGANLLTAGSSAVAADTAGGISTSVPRNEGLLAESKREANPDYSTSSPAKNPNAPNKGIGSMITNVPGALPGYAAQGIVDPTVGPLIANKQPVEAQPKTPKNLNDWVRGMSQPELDAILKEHPHLKGQIGTDKDGGRIIIPQNEEPALGTGSMTRAQEKAYERMSPKEFKKAVGEVDGPGPAGMGYVELSGGRTEKVSKGTPDFVKVINQPSRGIGGVDISGLNPEQATALAHLRTANKGDAVAASMAEDRRERLDLLRQNADENRGLKRETNFDKTLAGVGSVYDTDSGKMVLHPALGLFSLYQQGYDEKNVPEHYKPVMNKVKTEFERFVNDWAASPKSKKGGAAVTAAERMSLAKIFENRLKGTSAPK